MLCWQPSNSSCAAWQKMAMNEGWQMHTALSQRKLTSLPFSSHSVQGLGTPAMHRSQLWGQEMVASFKHKIMCCQCFLCTKPKGCFSRASVQAGPCSVEWVKWAHQHFCLTISSDGRGFVLVETPQGHIVLSVGPVNKMVLPIHLPHCFPHLSLIFPGQHFWELCNWIQS